MADRSPLLLQSAASAFRVPDRRCDQIFGRVRYHGCRIVSSEILGSQTLRKTIPANGSVASLVPNQNDGACLHAAGAFICNFNPVGLYKTHFRPPFFRNIYAKKILSITTTRKKIECCLLNTENIRLFYSQTSLGLSPPTDLKSLTQF